MKPRLSVLVGTSVAVVGLGIIAVLAPRVYEQVVADTYKLTYWIEPGIADSSNMDSRISFYANTHGFSAVKTTRNKAIFTITAKSQPGSTPVRFARVGKPVALTSKTIVNSSATPIAYLAATRTDTHTADMISQLKTSAPDTTWRLDAVGDIIIGRDVYLKMLQFNPLHPFEKYAAELKSADLAVADLENAFSDSRAVITSGGMTFVSPSRGAAGLKSSGIDAVNIANNHSFNAGAAGYLETIATLDALGIPHFGGGKNETEAHTPLITTVKGTKVAMLGYSSIVGSHAAGPDDPGMSYLDMAPWGTLNEDQVVRMESDIRAAKAKSDVVLVYYHWGTEYTHQANNDQRGVAHRAIDAGADVILGTHPHWVQGIEWYHDRLIAYSLGNFIFDQEWSHETKQGTLLQLTFDGATIAEAALDPYTVSDFNQPSPATSETAQTTLLDIFTHSWWPK